MLSAFSVIDNPWHMAADRAENTGHELAARLREQALGKRPVSLVGFSLGTRVIFTALADLACSGSHGIVDSADLVGAAVTPDAELWGPVRPVVAGRLVNAYSE